MKNWLRYIVTGVIIVFLLLMLVWVVQPYFEHKRNLAELEEHIDYFNSAKHPDNTKAIYQKEFFGNSSGTGNHCEHVIVQIRKYDLEQESEIADHYNSEYDALRLEFVRTLGDCCGDYERYETVCLGYVFDDQPKLNHINADSILPVYVVSYWVDGSHLWDWECY